MMMIGNFCIDSKRERNRKERKKEERKKEEERNKMGGDGMERGEKDELLLTQFNDLFDY